MYIYRCEPAMDLCIDVVLSKSKRGFVQVAWQRDSYHATSGICLESVRTRRT